MRNRFLFLLCALLTTTMMMAQKTISGVVIDKNSGEPLIGASVMEEGTTNGTVTDFDGFYTLTVKDGAQIIISYMGYEEQSIGAKDNLKIELAETTQEMDELVVIGYGVQRKSDLTGAISSVKGEDLAATPVANAMQALQGKAAGVQVVQNSGAPGSSTTIKIRGTGTINNSDPLYVVDGFIVDNIDYLNPSDIANMEILKDAASSAIYGARGANGVVLITTKSGESGKLRVDVDAYAGFSNPWHKIPVLGLEEYALIRDYMTNSELYSSHGQLYMSVDENGNLYQDQAKVQRIDSFRHNSVDDWWDAITRTGLKQNYNVSLSGGSEKNKFLVSLGYFGENGIVKTSDYQRFTAHVNNDNTITKWLTAQTNVSYTYDNRNMVPEGANGVLKNALYCSPLTYLKNNVGYWNSQHPVAILDVNHNRRQTHNINLNLALNFKLGRFFNYQFKVSDYANFAKREQFDEVKKLETDFVMPGDLSTIYKTSEIVNKWEVNNLLHFNWNNAIHNVSATIGHTVEHYSYDYQYSLRKGTAGNSDNYHQLNAAYTGDYTRGYTEAWSAMGFVARVNYSALDRYLLQANFRADASSLFNAKNRWGLFPSVSVGWKFSSEPWLQDQNVLSLGKLRAGWGMLGNNRIGVNSKYTLIDQGYNYIYGANELLFPGASATTIGCSDITWEKTQSYNVGIDLNFFNNSLSSSFEYYDKLTTDMLLEVPVPNSAGLLKAPMVNAGSVRNRGVEATISYKGSAAKNKFKYEIGLNIAYLQNRVESLGTGNEPVWGAYLNESSIQSYVTKTEVGRPIGCFYGYVVDGIFQTDEEVRASAQEYDNTNFREVIPGCFKFKDLNGDGIINEEDRTYLGSPHPDIVYGIPVMFSFYGVQIDLFFQGQAGNKIFNVMEHYMANSSTYGNMYANVGSTHWSGGENASWETRKWFPANTTGATTPDLYTSDAAYNFRPSDYFVKDGSYCRLKTLTLSYNFPESVCQKMRAQNFSIYATVYNVATFTKYNGLDPEVGKFGGEEANNLYMGVDHGNYPQSRSFTFGLKLGF